MKWSVLAIAAIVALGGCDSQVPASGRSSSPATTSSPGGVSGAGGNGAGGAGGSAAARTRTARCCVVSDVFSNSKSSCQLSQPTTFNCDDRNPWQSQRWTCGSAATACTDNGRSCAVGDTCRLLQQDDCAGVVKECAYPWYDKK